MAFNKSCYCNLKMIKSGLGILWDVYNSGSLKHSAQENRGTEIHKHVVAHGKLRKIGKASSE